LSTTSSSSSPQYVLDIIPLQQKMNHSARYQAQFYKIKMPKPERPSSSPCGAAAAAVLATDSDKKKAKKKEMK
jgi:hypothetical protein